MSEIHGSVPPNTRMVEIYQILLYFLATWANLKSVWHAELMKSRTRFEENRTTCKLFWRMNWSGSDRHPRWGLVTGESNSSQPCCLWFLKLDTIAQNTAGFHVKTIILRCWAEYVFNLSACDFHWVLQDCKMEYQAGFFCTTEAFNCINTTQEP
jgi:hypothetical protein